MVWTDEGVGNGSLTPLLAEHLAGLLTQVHPCAAQDAIKDTLQGIYSQTMTAMRTAKTRAEIERIVRQTDMPVLTNIGEYGHVSTSTRAQTVHDLEEVIAQPKREKWDVRIIWAFRDQDRATAVAWVYTKPENADGEQNDGKKGVGHSVVFGTIVRDKWVLTRDGWRRGSHQKIFPDRFLVGAGQETILPR